MDALIKMPEAFVLRLAAVKADIDLLQHDSQLEKGEHFVIIDDRKIAKARMFKLQITRSPNYKFPNYSMPHGCFSRSGFLDYRVAFVVADLDCSD